VFPLGNHGDSHADIRPHEHGDSYSEPIIWLLIHERTPNESRNSSDLHPVAVGQRLIRGKAKQPVTYDQSTVLVVHRLLLSELRTASANHLVDDWRIRTNLVFDDDIPEVFREFAHRLPVCIVFLVANCTGALGQGL
jgi:hypothetical protein